MIRALIADDEPLLRDMLKFRLQQVWPELEVVAEAESGAEAVQLFDEFEPDLAFLDIQMPVMTGVEVARVLAKRCHIVFVTAYDEYAVEAFNRGAIDYVLKPVNAERLAETVERLKERLASSRSAPIGPLEELLAAFAARTGSRGEHGLKWIKASQGQHLHLIAVPDIIYFRAEDKYTKVMTASGELLIKKPIKELSEELDGDAFWQIHRSTIVNVHCIDHVGRDHRDQPLIYLKGRDETLIVSRAFAHLFKQM
ncbi:MAG: response regulator transcription factor [Burkholderiales bacterium]|nr:response regulator transcription factor [Burkholderiales bacterium]